MVYSLFVGCLIFLDLQKLCSTLIELVVQRAMIYYEYFLVCCQAQQIIKWIYLFSAFCIIEAVYLHYTQYTNTRIADIRLQLLAEYHQGLKGTESRDFLPLFVWRTLYEYAFHEKNCDLSAVVNYFSDTVFSNVKIIDI